MGEINAGIGQLGELFQIVAAKSDAGGSVASMFISRWDAAVAGKVPTTLNNRPGIAIAGRIHQVVCCSLDSAPASVRP